MASISVTTSTMAGLPPAIAFSKAGGKRPAEVAGAAQEALASPQVVHAAHPHAGMPGVGEHDRVLGHMPAQLGADSFRAHRRGVGLERRLVLALPFPANAFYLFKPFRSLHV